MALNLTHNKYISNTLLNVVWFKCHIGTLSVCSIESVKATMYKTEVETPINLFFSLIFHPGYFSSHSRQVNVATWVLVLPSDKENQYDYREGDYIYHIYSFMSSSWHHILAISPAIKIYREGDNRRIVNTRTTPHISDQLGTENACRTLLCWFMVMIRVLVCNNLIICISINIISDLSTTIRDGFDSLPVNGSTRDIFLNTTTGNNYLTGVSFKLKCENQM